jgi:hypothetical protein
MSEVFFQAFSEYSRKWHCQRHFACREFHVRLNWFDFGLYSMYKLGCSCTTRRCSGAKKQSRVAVRNSSTANHESFDRNL